MPKPAPTIDRARRCATALASLDNAPEPWRQFLDGLKDRRSMRKALLAVCDELAAQDEEWGVQDHDDDTWADILAEEVFEATQECLDALPSEREEQCESLTELARAGHAGLLRLKELPASEREQRGRHAAAAYAELTQVAAVALQWAACIMRHNPDADFAGGGVK